MAALSGTPQLKFFGTDNLPLAGGLLATADKATGIAKAMFHDRLLTVPHSNPIVLDAEGECVAYKDTSTAYQYELRDRNGALLPGYKSLKTFRITVTPVEIDLVAAFGVLNPDPAVYTITINRLNGYDKSIVATLNLPITIQQVTTWQGTYGGIAIAPGDRYIPLPSAPGSFTLEMGGDLQGWMDTGFTTEMYMVITGVGEDGETVQSNSFKIRYMAG